MPRHVTIKFDLEPNEYGDPEDYETPEQVKELVVAMFENHADWPWPGDPKLLGGPVITIE